MITKIYTDTKTKVLNEEKRIVEAIITSEVMDRDKELVKSDGINFKNYNKNPIVLWSHDHKIPAIGKNIEVKKNNTSLTAITEFADTEFASEIYKLVKGGFIRAVSIGFNVEQNGIRNANKFDKEKYGKELRTIISKSELYEYSFVNLPANQNSLVTAIKEKIVSENFVTAYFKYQKEEKKKTNKKYTIYCDILEKELKQDIKKEIKDAIIIEKMRKMAIIYY